MNKLDYEVIELMIQQEVPVRVWHKTGLKFIGQIIAQDENCIVMDNEEKGTQIQYKSAFSSIEIPETINLKQKSPD